MDEFMNALSKVFYIAEVLTARLFSPQSGHKMYTLCVCTCIKFIVREITFISRPYVYIEMPGKKEDKFINILN